MNLLALPDVDHKAEHDAATPGLLRQALERIAEQAERPGRVMKSAHDFVRCGEQPHESLAVRCDRTIRHPVLLNLARNDIHAMQTTRGNTATRLRAGVRARAAGRGHGVPRHPGRAPPGRKRRNSLPNTGRPILIA